MCKVDIDHWRCPHCNQDIVGGGYPGRHGAVNKTSWRPCHDGRSYSRHCPNLGRRIGCITTSPARPASKAARRGASGSVGGRVAPAVLGVCPSPLARVRRPPLREEERQRASRSKTKLRET